MYFFNKFINNPKNTSVNIKKYHYAKLPCLAIQLIKQFRMIE